MQAFLPNRQHVLSKTSDSIDTLLQGARQMAKSFTDTSLGTMTPESYNTAIVSARSALSDVVVALDTEHGVAEREVNRQFGEITACREHATHGLAAVSARLGEAQSAEDASIQCNQELVSAQAEQTRLCNVWSNLAESLSSSEPPCRATHATPEAFYENFQLWKAHVSAQDATIESSRAACDTATSSSAAKQAECNTLAGEYHDAFCLHALACGMGDECQRHETGVFNDLVPDVRLAMQSRHGQYQVVKQIECLLDLAASAMESDQTITSAEMEACDRSAAGSPADVTHLTIEFPTIPALQGCPASQDGDPECHELAQISEVSDWINGGTAAPIAASTAADVADASLEIINGYVYGASGGDASCPAGWHSIMDLEECRRASQDLGNPTSFSEGDWSGHCVGCCSSQHIDEANSLYGPTYREDYLRSVWFNHNSNFAPNSRHFQICHPSEVETPTNANNGVLFDYPGVFPSPSCNYDDANLFPAYDSYTVDMRITFFELSKIRFLASHWSDDAGYGWYTRIDGNDDIIGVHYWPSPAGGPNQYGVGLRLPFSQNGLERGSEFHFTLTYDSTTRRMTGYINGNLATNTESNELDFQSPPEAGGSGMPLCIGTWANPHYVMEQEDGQVKDFRLSVGVNPPR